jgi:hypothetical protein
MIKFVVGSRFSQLKKTLEELVPKQRKALGELKKAVGNKVIGEIRA